MSKYYVRVYNDGQKEVRDHLDATGRASAISASEDYTRFSPEGRVYVYELGGGCEECLGFWECTPYTKKRWDGVAA